MRRIFLILAVGVVFVLPAFSFAADALVPCSGVEEKVDGVTYPVCQVCHAVELGQRVINFLVIIASSIAVAIFAWAGFLMITAAGNEGQVTKAKGMFWNVLLGLVITLAGWLIIDTVMKWAFQGQDGSQGSDLYEQAKRDWNFGPWNEIRCAKLPPNKPPSDAPAGSQTGTSGGPSGAGASTNPQSGGPRGLKGSVQCHADNQACSVQALMAAGYTEAQANTMSCIAMSESNGMPNGPNSKTGACGTFQVIRGNWNNSALHRGNCSTATSCNNAECNMQTAFILSQNRVRAGKSPYGDWTCPNCNHWAHQCVANYDPRWRTTNI